MTRVQPLASPKAETWSIREILHLVKAGRLCVPDFQRSFRWERSDMLKLFDSLYRGYPVGNLLIWETDSKAAVRPVFDPLPFELQRHGRFLIIDGQQRITTLAATMLGGGEHDRRFEIYFDLETETFKHRRHGEQPSDHWLPLSQVAETVEYLEWLQRKSLPTHLVSAANHLVGSLRDYKLPVYTVRGDQDEQIREIFRRLNTTGRALKEAEIFNAIHGGKDKEQLAKIRRSLRSLNFGHLNDTWLLKALAATLGLERSKTLSKAFDDMSTEEQGSAIATVSGALRGVIDFLRDDAEILHWSLLPYRFPIIPLAAFYARYDRPSAAARRTLRDWLWRGAASGAHAAISQPVVRTALKSIKEAPNAEDAAERLLSALESVPREYSMAKVHNFSNAATKIACVVLANKRPRALATGEAIDPVELLNGGAPFHQLVVDVKLGTESRLMHPGLAKGPKSNARAMRDLLLRAELPAEVASSHVISSEALAMLAAGDEKGFLQVRRTALETETSSFLHRMTGVTST